VIDLSNLRTPGWQRVVADLAAPASDDAGFLERLAGVLGEVCGARQAVSWRVDAGGEPAAFSLWVPRAGRAVSSQPPPIALEAEARRVCRAAIERGHAVVFSLDDDELYDGSGGRGSLIALPVAGLSGAVISLLVEPRSRAALQTTLAIAELAAGYAHHHAALRALERAKASSASLDLAARLIAGINSARGFRGAAMQLANDLCRRLNLDRVAVGWARGGSKDRGGAFTRVIALSDTEQVDRRMAMIRRIESAMDECLDQEQAVLFPPPVGDDADPLLSRAIVHAHRELAAGDARVRLLSVPLRIEDGVVGVVLCESAGRVALDAEAAEMLQSAMDLVAPVLAVRRSDDRTLAARSLDWMVRVGAWVVGPRHTAWKLAGLLASVLVLLATLVPVPYRVGADMELMPRLARTVSMPHDGVIAELGPAHRAGDAVEQGDLLLRLDTTELELSRLDVAPEVTRFEKIADEALRRGEVAEAQRAHAQADQARARLALIDERLARSTIRAPITGRIVAGDLSDRLGASLRQGEVLLELADTADLIVLARLDDRDAGLVREGSRGTIATASDPARRIPVTVERVVPMARPEEGRNVFHVRCVLDEPAPWLRPGMQGRARFDADRRSLVRIAGRRFLDAARLWAWWSP
jgi:multidrug efflux pump subunit AcrA (membrane-fusion protein)